VRILVSQLSFVAITLDAEDNPYRIFESLNAKGMPLTQGDLLRNYFFMRLPPAEHERWYTQLWWPMQRRLGERFDAFMRDFLLKDGDAVRPDEVYQEWRKRLGPLGEDDIRAILNELAAWSLEYDHIVHPERGSDPAVRKLLEWLSAWSKTLQQTIDPLLMRINADFRRHQLSSEEAQQIFTAIASFLVRRSFGSAPAIDENAFIGLYNAAARATDRTASSAARAEGAGQRPCPVRHRHHPSTSKSPDRRKLSCKLEDSYAHSPIHHEQIECN
jgi:hypothetical protein